MKKRIYIAGPMSQGDRLGNLAQALEAFRELIEAGYAPFCPQLTYYVDTLIPLPHSAWLSVDLPWVAVADAVLRLPGESIGAAMETDLAHRLGKPVFYSVAQLLRSLLP